MKYVGIDLGTTNSVVCSYDGEQIRLYKSPEQHDVTPSVIFIDKRGNKYVGARAYNTAARNPDNAAMLFKRLMGTSTPVKLPAVGLTMSPEDCSAEILRVLFGYLPEEIRDDASTGTVITVPAAFNQMQKESTMAAAQAAGIGKVVLKVTMARFSRTLATLVAAGVDIIKALEISGSTAGNWVVESALADVRAQVHQGVPIAQPLVENPVFPPLVSQMVKVGEETGELERMLDKIADFYEDEVDTSIAALTSIVEPLMMIGVGAIVGVIIIAMYLPMFKLLELVQ